MPRSRHVLFVESSFGDIGGSLISLLTLVSHLGPGYRKTVLLLQESMLRQRLEAAASIKANITQLTQL